MPEVADKFYEGAGHFASDTNFEVQRQNHFEIMLDLSKIIPNNTDIERHIRLSTKSITAPKISSEPIPLKHGNETVKVAAAPVYEDLTIVVYDTIGKDQLGVLQAWYNKVFDYGSKLMGLVSQYKARGILYMYSPDCSIIRKWELEGVWPKEFGQDNAFDFDSTGVQTITLGLSVDRYREVLDVGSST